MAYRDQYFYDGTTEAL